MFKIMLKLIYILLSLMVSYLIFDGSFNILRSQSETNYIVNNTNNPDKIAELYGYTNKDEILFDTSSKENVVAIYNSIFSYSANWVEDITNADGSVKSYSKKAKEVLNTYYMVILNPNFSYDNNNSYNNAAIRFYGLDGITYYDYSMIQNNDNNNSNVISIENKSLYCENPKSEYEAILGEERGDNVLSSSKYNIIEFSFHEKLVKAIENELGSSIKYFEIIDSNNNVASGTSKNEITFDFSEQFYSDLKLINQIYNNIYSYEMGSLDYSKSAAINAYNKLYTMFKESNIYLKSSDDYKTSVDTAYNEGKEVLNNIESTEKASVIFNTLLEEIYKLSDYGLNQLDKLIDSGIYNYQKSMDISEVIDYKESVIPSILFVLLFIIVVGVGYFMIFHFKSIRRNLEYKKKQNKPSEVVIDTTPEYIVDNDNKDNEA